MNWIDKINKELEEIRKASKESTDKTNRAQSGMAKEREAALKAMDPEGYVEFRRNELRKVREIPGHQSKAGHIGGSKTAKQRKESGYFQSKEWKESQLRGSYTSGANNVESGHWLKVREAGNAKSHSKVECGHCKEPGDLVNIQRYHNDNCPYPAIKQVIAEHIPTEKEFKSKPLAAKIAKASGVSKDKVSRILKRFYIKPSGKHNMWLWEPVAEGEGPRYVIMYKKIPYTDPERADKLSQMLYDLIPFDDVFTIKQLPDVQSQCEYRLNVRHILMNSPKYFTWDKIKNTYNFKKVAK